MRQPGRADRPRTATSSLTGALAVAVVARLLLNTARRFPYPFAPVLQRGLDVPLPAVTSLIAATQATAFASPFFGPLGDRWGTRPLMVGGAALLAVGMLTGAALPTYGAVLIGVFLAGLGKSIFDPAVQAYVGERVPYRRRGLAIGLIELSWSGAALLGIPVVGILIAHWGWRAPFLVLGVLGIGAVWALARVLPDAGGTSGPRSREARGGWRMLAREPAARAALAFGFLISAANDNLFVAYGAWLEQGFGLSVAALGAATVAIGAAEVGGELLTAGVSDRIGLQRALSLGVLVAAATYALLPLCGRALPGALAGLFTVFLAYEFTIVTSFSLFSEVLPEGRTTMLAAYAAALGAGRVAGALTGGALWGSTGIWGNGLFAAGLTFAAWAALRHGLRHWKPRAWGERPLPGPPLE